jgi:hypothetical protein
MYFFYSTGCTDNANALSADGVPELDYTDVDLGLAQRGPHFDLAYSKNVTALVGKTAQLNCRVHDLGNRTVSQFSLFNLSRFFPKMVLDQHLRFYQNYFVMRILQMSFTTSKEE